MSYKRNNVPVGQTVTLQAIFIDSANKPMDYDSIDIKIYDSGNTLQSTVTSATKISTGFYEITYTVGATAKTGTWTDQWTATISGVEVQNSFSFNVTEMGSAVTQNIGGNTLIVILLDSAIADTSGNTLAEEAQYTFSTRYNPYYASPDLLRLECGTWLDNIPNDTLSLMIHWSSKEADFITPTGARKSSNSYKVARTKFVIFDVALRCLTLPAASAGGGTKQLGDLLVKKDSSFANVVKDLKEKREEWFRVLNAGATIVPGQGFAPSVAMKGQYHPERRRVGRLWWDPADFPFQQPGGNQKFRKSGQRKFRKGFGESAVDGRYPSDEEPD